MTPTIIAIQERACEVFGISMEELTGPLRTDHVAKPRMMVMAWCSELGYRSGVISAAFNRDRTTVNYARRSNHFTKLELERMEQVKASFDTLPYGSKINIESIQTIQPEIHLIRHSPPASDYKTRIECWKPTSVKTKI